MAHIYCTCGSTCAPGVRRSLSRWHTALCLAGLKSEKVSDPFISIHLIEESVCALLFVNIQLCLQQSFQQMARTQWNVTLADLHNDFLSVYENHEKCACVLWLLVLKYIFLKLTLILRNSQQLQTHAVLKRNICTQDSVPANDCLDIYVHAWTPVEAWAFT